jgi:hypothetical protein
MTTSNLAPTLALAVLGALVTLPLASAGPWTGPVDAIEITAPGPEARGGWDPAVAVDGDLAVVGDGDAARAGIFERQGASWRRVATLPPDGSEGREGFGAAVDTDGRRVLVGAPGADVDAPNGSYGGTNAGAAYLYGLTDDGWLLEHRFLGEPKVRTEDYFGRGVALRGDVAAVGSPGIMSGDVHVFRHQDGWDQEAHLLGRTFDGLGTGLDLDADGDLLAAGAPGLSGALLYARDDGTWDLDGDVRTPDGSDAYWAGWDVAAVDEAVVLGARSGGEAWGFHRSSQGWSQGRELPSPASASDAFGRSVAVHGNHVAVGDPRDGDGGSVTVLEVGSDGRWTRTATIDPWNEGGADGVGVDVALADRTLAAASRLTAGDGAAPVFGVAPDADDDGLADWREQALGTHPLDPDTDDDGLEDGPERDGYGTSPLDPDTDGDLHGDGTEVEAGSSPTNPLSVPAARGAATPAPGPTDGTEAPATDHYPPVR